MPSYSARLRVAAALRLAALIALGIALAACEQPPTPAPGPAAPAPQTAAPEAQPPAETAVPERAPLSRLPDFTVLVEQQGPAVVNVVTARKARGGSELPNDPMFDFFRRFMPAPPEPGPESRSHGLGSGFIISADGYILTNAHVVAEADEVTVRLADSREFRGRTVGIDRRTDIALLKVEAHGLPVVKPGSSETLKVGEWVAAIGSPFGFVNTITAGIVSAKGRSLTDESFVPFIQTDVAVNPGNSGGPLLNLRGEVVGINSAIYSRTGGYMGVSFAIPIEVALDVSRQLRETGKVTRGRLGVQIQALTPELAKSFKLPSAKGVLITSVERGGPADKAGLKAGDVVLGFEGKPVESVNELPRIVAGTKPGASVAIDIWRDGARRQVKATLGESLPERVAQNAPEAARAPSRLGLALRELDPVQRRALGLDYGIAVENASGTAHAAGIRRGDLILAVNNAPVHGVTEFNRMLQQHASGSVAALLVRRGEATLYVALRIASSAPGR